MNSRRTRFAAPAQTVGQARLKVSGRIVGADTTFCTLALGGRKPRPGSNALRIGGLAHWGLQDLLSAARRTGAVVVREVEHPGGDPARRLVLRLAPRVTASGTVREFVLLVEASRDYGAALQALAAERDEARRSARQKGEFLANMSHELRTPLNAIIGFLRLVEEGEKPHEEERKDYLRSARAAAMSLLELVNNILDLAKIEANRMTLEAVEFNPLHLAEEVCKTLAPQAHGKGIEIAASAAPGVPPIVRGDLARLRQVLTNLAGNAVKFTATGAVLLSIAPASDGGRPGTLRFAVQDTGVGIPEEVQKQLFQSYVQRDRSIARRFGGTGLGLAICRQLVQQMGGAIGVESREGKGSTFWFTIPLEIPTGTPQEGRPPLSGARAVVLDPNGGTALAMARNLEALGAAATTAATAREAQCLLQQMTDKGTPAQLVLVDHAVRRDAALSFAHSVRTGRSTFRPDLIYLAGIGQVPDPETLRAGGFSVVLIKPVPRALLADTARDLLRRQDAHGSSYVAPLRKPSTDLASLVARHQKRVLVAEDNAVNQKLIQALLAKLGYRVTLVSNGKAAVEAASEEAYDLVLMDVQMPMMDGLSATREIRRRVPGRLPIVAMTADAMDGDREKCLAAGMDDYLAKPILPDQLNSMLDHWLSGAGSEKTAAKAAAESGWMTLDQEHLNGVLAYAKAHRPEAFAEFLDLFRRELTLALRDMTLAVRQEDWKGLAAGAHTAALIAEGFGAPRLEACALELEAHCGEAHPLLARDLLERLQLEAKTVQLHLQRAYGGACAGPTGE
jgi:signal transduction histidine kinase/CheY-like chemotaxis protein